MQCALGPLVSMDFRTLFLSEGLAFTAVTICTKHLVDLPSEV